MPADSQFQRTGQYPGNWDRCSWCGYPRMLHGSDGGCGFNVSRVGRFLTTLAIAGGVLGGAIWALLSNPAITAGSLAAVALLAAVAVLVIGAKFVALRSERHATHR